MSAGLKVSNTETEGGAQKTKKAHKYKVGLRRRK